jgi:hypothetical protein
MSNMVEVMAKLRNARNLDVRQSGMVDSAYFAVKAADKAVKRKQRPPVHEYIRHLVYERLAAGEVTKVGGRVPALWLFFIGCWVIVRGAAYIVGIIGWQGSLARGREERKCCPV